MSKLLWIAGILLIAAGIALGVALFVSVAAVAGWLGAEVPALFLVGGLLCVGLGGVIDAVDALREAQTVPSYVSPLQTASTTIPEFGRRISEPPPAPVAAAAAATAAVAPAAAPVKEQVEVSEPVMETIQALEQARQKIEQAFEPKPSDQNRTDFKAKPEREPEPLAEPERQEQPVDEAPEAAEVEVVEVEVIEEEALADGQLYVVEERIIRARPARILSDGTVEAETDEGWMRFENLEHLDEYLDAMAPATRG